MSVPAGRGNCKVIGGDGEEDLASAQREQEPDGVQLKRDNVWLIVGEVWVGVELDDDEEFEEEEDFFGVDDDDNFEGVRLLLLLPPFN